VKGEFCNEDLKLEDFITIKRCPIVSNDQFRREYKALY